MADLIALLLVTLSTLFGSGADDDQFASLLRQAVMKSKPVPLEKVLVDCEGCSTRSIDSIEFSFTNITLDPLLIKTAEISIDNLHHDDQGRITMNDLAFSAHITETDLTDAMQKHLERLKDSTISMDKRGLTLRGNHALLGVKIPYSVRGTLSVENDSQLVFNIDQSQLSGLNMPAGLNALIEREVNPVYDLKAFASRSRKDIERAKEQLGYEFALQIEKITYGQGHIIVVGSA